jgi:hypothetical protein
MGTSKFMILVPLFDVKSLGSFRRLRCRDFKSAALDHQLLGAIMFDWSRFLLYCSLRHHLPKIAGYPWTRLLALGD